MPVKYDAVFFDFDGTVVDSLQDIVDAVNHTMRQFGLPEFTRDYLQRRLGWGVRTLMQLSLPADTPEERLNEIIAAYRPYYAAHAGDKSKPFDGIVPMLRRLKQCGVALAILSNKPDEALQPITRRFFSDLVELSAGERAGVRRKPAPDMLEDAATRLGVQLKRCLYVGDSEVDIDTAVNAGIDCVCVTWGFRTREQLESAGARVIIDDPAELIGIVTGE